MELDMTWLRYQVDADDCMWQQELHCSFAKERILSEQLKSILISNSKIFFFFDKPIYVGFSFVKYSR